MNRIIVCAFALFTTVCVCNDTWAAPDKVQVDKANALFAKSIAHYKTFKSFEFRAQEKIEFPSKNVVVSRYYGSMQKGKTVERAFLLWQERESYNKYDSVSSAQILGANSFTQKGAAIDGNKWGTFAVTNVAGREAKAKHLVSSQLTLFLSIWSLGIGYNPVKAPTIKHITVARKNNLDTVILERPGDKQTQLKLNFSFDARTSELRKFSLTETQGVQVTRATLEFSGVKSNWRGSQSATDKAVYNWKYFAPTWFKKPGK